MPTFLVRATGAGVNARNTTAEDERAQAKCALFEASKRGFALPVIAWTT